MSERKSRSLGRSRGNNNISSNSKAANRKLRLELNAVLNAKSVAENEDLWATDDSRLAATRNLEQCLSKLRQMQGSQRCLIPRRRQLDFDQFSDWLSMNGVKMTEASFRFGPLQTEGHDNWTVFAVRDIKECEEIVHVPSTAMMTTDAAYLSPIGNLIRRLPALNAIPSVVLALFLISEAANADSRFQPYIRTLPAKFSIPFSYPFSAEQYAALRPSQAFERAVKTFKSQVMQYARIYEALCSEPDMCHALQRENFTYENFEWAISVVMTRQNQIPSPSKGTLPSIALVPVWDMCNHEYGPQTTSVVLDPVSKSVSVECKAMRNYKKGDALSIFYGNRSNIELLLFSGFVHDRNDSDCVDLEVSLEGNDKRNTIKNIVTLRKFFGSDVHIVKNAHGASVVRAVVKSDGTIDSVLSRWARKPSEKCSGRDDSENISEISADDAIVKRLCTQLLISAINGRQRQSDEAASAIQANSTDVGYQLIRKLHNTEGHLLRRALENLHPVESIV